MNKNKLNYSLTNIDIEKYLGTEHIIKYSDLNKYQNIDQAFGDNKFLILLIESGRNRGHWVCLLRYNDGTIEQFDSYSGKIDSELKFITSSMRRNLHENNCILTQLLRNRKSIWSKYRYQKLDNDVDTCGRWIILRILMFVEGGMELDHFENWFLLRKNQRQLSNDEICCELIKF